MWLKGLLIAILVGMFIYFLKYPWYRPREGFAGLTQWIVITGFELIALIIGTALIIIYI